MLFFLHKKHKEMWTFLADHPFAWKQSWPGMEQYKHIINGCFACDYEDKIPYKKHMCYNCPLVWPGNTCLGVNGLYSQWVDAAGDMEKRAKLALQIANLRVKEGVICK